MTKLKSFWVKKVSIPCIKKSYVILLEKKDTQQHVYVDMIATNPIFKASSTIICDRISLIIFFFLSLSLSLFLCCAAVNWLSNFDKCSFTLSSLSTTIEKEKVDFCCIYRRKKNRRKIGGVSCCNDPQISNDIVSMRRCASMRSVIGNRLQLTCN